MSQKNLYIVKNCQEYEDLSIYNYIHIKCVLYTI